MPFLGAVIKPGCGVQVRARGVPNAYRMQVLRVLILIIVGKSGVQSPENLLCKPVGSIYHRCIGYKMTGPVVDVGTMMRVSNRVRGRGRGRAMPMVPVSVC